MGDVLLVVAVRASDGGVRTGEVLRRELEGRGFGVVHLDPEEAPEIRGRFSPPSPPLPGPLSLFPHTPISLSPSPLPSTSSTLPAARRKKRAAEDTSPTASLHKWCIDRFYELWKAKRGGEYRVVGGRDGKCVRDLLRFPEATQGEIERRMLNAFADPWFRQHGNLAIFVSRWSNYDRGVTPLAATPVAAPRAEGRRITSLADVMAASGGSR